VLIFSGNAQENSANANQKKNFEAEFGCLAQIAENSSLTNKDLKSKYYYPLVARQADKLLGLEERSENGKEARLYLFTEEGWYITALNQTNSWQEFRYLIKIDGVEKVVGLDRIEKDQKYKSLMFTTAESESAKKLSLYRGEQMRKVLIEALGEKIQSMRSTFDARSDLRNRALTGLIQKDPKFKDKVISLEGYFELLPEKLQLQISKKQDPAVFLKQLNDCKLALGSNEKYQSLRDLADAEILKFNSKPAQTAPVRIDPNPEIRSIN
jgi:hypothetical protein